MPNETLIRDIRLAAKELGYDDVGITKPTLPQADKDALKEWLKKNHHAGMKWMERPVRLDPKELLPGAKTAILFISYYRQEEVPFTEKKGVVASYARGRDYHNVHKRRLKQFIRWFEEKVGEEDCCRPFSDASPIMERALAVQAGLGWFGKNNLLIHRRLGTFTLLSGILTTVEVEGTKVVEERRPRCGTCTKCIDHCPTGALSPYELDSSRCLSYHLIESKEPIPQEIAAKNPGYLFGCDICQDVCPHNVRKEPTDSKDFSPENGIGALLDLNQLNEIEEDPEKLYVTPLKRRKAKGLSYNWKTLWNESAP